jgi:hypothetical protein
LARHGWFQHSDAVCIEIDLAEIIAGKRSKEHLAISERGHLACFGVTPPPLPFSWRVGWLSGAPQRPYRPLEVQLRRRAQGVTLDELARSYKVNRATISRLAM